ncbi:MAG: hypothetical protein KF899_15360 [Parvibaculum sp.]|nr:hypothetical protein [Parvibaculum sp.]
MSVEFNREALFADAASIRVHPEFRLAMRRHTDIGLTVADGHPLVAKLICQTSRYATMALILCLDDLAAEGGSAGGVTVSQVIAAIGRTPFASVSWAKLMVRVFHRGGLIEYSPAGPDRRTRPFYPTPQLIEMGQQSIEIFLEALAFVRPLPMPAAELARQPGVLTGFAREVVECYFAHRFSMLEPFPETEALFERDFGYLIFTHLIQTMQAQEGAHVFGSAPAGELSRRFGVSRATVRNVLDIAEGKGLIANESKAGHRIRFTPAFVDLAERWVATDLAWLNYLLKRTTARLGIECGRN